MDSETIEELQPSNISEERRLIMLRKSSICLILLIGFIIVSMGTSHAWKWHGWKHKKLKGVFYDSPIQGVWYKTPSGIGITNRKGEFKYRKGDRVTFWIGGVVLGSAKGQERITPAHLVPEVDGDVEKITNQKVTNLSRFLQSLDKDGNVENGIKIKGRSRYLVWKYRDAIDFDQSEEDFTESVTTLFEKLNLTLRTAAQARNHLRRSMLGIKKMTDVKIPMRDDSYLLADIFRPIEKGKYPVLVTLGPYGKAFEIGCICSEEDLLEKEFFEDRYFSGNPDNFPYENHESPATVDWVPAGYVVVRVDSRGFCNTPGTQDIFSDQEIQDYYDAIEWLAKQKWSTGNVGSIGISYYAMNQWILAKNPPPSLKAMIPWEGGFDMYRDSMWHGGIRNRFADFWYPETMERFCVPEGEDPDTWEPDRVDFYGAVTEAEFDAPEPWDEMSGDFDAITLPFLSGMGLFNTRLHLRGNSEAFQYAVSENKKLHIHFEGHTASFYNEEGTTQCMRFFDYWLKGIDNGVMDEPPVRAEIPIGDGDYYLAHFDDWPVPGTQYTKFYLDTSSQSTVSVDGVATVFHDLVPSTDVVTEISNPSTGAPTEEASATYSADRTNPDSIISFISPPLTNEVVLLGHAKMVTWVSASTYDMDIFATLSVVDSTGQSVIYDVEDDPLVGIGRLRVSHRALDNEKSTHYRPYHPHGETDYEELIPGGVPVEIEVEFWPMSAHIEAGYRIKIDVEQTGALNFYEPDYHQEDDTNTIYTGGTNESYIQLPIIPPPAP